MTKQWKAQWITSTVEPPFDEPDLTVEQMFVTHDIPEPLPNEERLRPPALLRTHFSVDPQKTVAKAELCITARGFYKTTVNGANVTEAVLTPDFTSYAKFLQYQTYDVTALIEQDNVWGIVLADGWYVGRISATGASCQFGDRLSCLGELTVTYTDGSAQTVCTGPDFECSTGKYVWSDIFIGERQDLRLDKPGWDTVTGLGGDGWEAAVPVEEDYSALAPQEGPYAVRRERLAAKDCWNEGDRVVVDFGQVIAGRVILRCHLAEGQEIRLEHAEVLDRDGTFFNNIEGRNKDQVNSFVGRGLDEVLEPDFTYQGFRYVRISGWEGAFDPTCIEAVAIYSDMAVTGKIATSDKRVNKLLENILWSQKGNMLGIPTDCPQRERMGWTGDIEVFAPTGTFFMDCETMLERWLRCVRADQGDDGQICDYSPAPKSIYTTGLFGSYSAAGWGDAIIMVPLTLYRAYGHRRVLEENYDAMVRWHDFCAGSAAEGKEVGSTASYVWDTKFNYGDWMFPSFMLGPNAKGPLETSFATKELVATAYLEHSTRLLAEVARVLGRDADAASYDAYADAVRDAFVATFYQGDGTMSVEFQGCYVIPLAFDLLPASERAATAAHLSEMIRANGDRLDTGFLSVPYLLDTLQRFGYEEQAEKVFFQEDCPSWLYEVEHGATSIWESWGAIQSDGTVGPHSFNHYAFGCVGDWIVRKVVGLSIREPGYAEFDVRPGQVRGLDFAELEFQSVHGRIALTWGRGPEGLRCELTVPDGCVAHVTLPGQTERALGGGEYVLYGA